MGKNKSIPGEERTIILRVLHYFEEEKLKGDFMIPSRQIVKRTHTATGVNVNTIIRIKREQKKEASEMSKSMTISAGEQKVILRVLQFFREEKRKGDFVIPVDKAFKRTCTATGVSLSTINRIKREEKKILETLNTGQGTSSLRLTDIPVIKLETPGKTRKGPPHNKLNIDEFTISSLRNIIERFYQEHEVPSLTKILAVAKAEFNFPGQKETLRKILVEKLDYSYKSVPNDEDISREGPKVTAWTANNTEHINMEPIYPSVILLKQEQFE